MLKLHKNDALTRGQLADKAKKKIPLYEERNNTSVQVPFFDMKAKKERFLRFSKWDNEWHFIEIVD